jgi:predicted DNA-binding transcriptional regulator YafY
MRRRASGDPRQQRIVARALEATLQHRQATLTYYSRSSDRTKSYLVHPYRLAFAQGGLYLLAFVPEYDEVRTFAVERVEEIALLEERFTPVEEVAEEAFPHSLGVHSGPPERVEIEFEASLADYIKPREWHRSQTLHEQPDGRIRMALQVSIDQALRSWILSFGGDARVILPESLAREIAEQFDRARARYGR